MKKLLSLLIGVLSLVTIAPASQSQSRIDNFTFDPLMSDKPIKLNDYYGKVILIVNTASKCGFTGQYKGLEALYLKYKAKGFVIIGIPSNDFGAQEPGTNKEIANFCKINYGVTFPMTTKYHVKGKNAHPFYIWAKKTLGFGTAPKWNFHKYLINRQGKLVDYFHSTTRPESSGLVSAIEKLLSEKQ